MAAERSINAALRRVGGVVVTLAFLGSAMAWYRSAPAREAGTAGAMTSAPSAPTSSAPTTSAPTTSAATAGTAPTPGVHVGDPGIRLTATISGTGRIEVVETIRLSAPSSTVSVAPPELSGVGFGFDRVKPSVVDLSVRAGTQPLAGTPRELHGPVSLAAPNGATTWQLRYQLDGVVVHSAPSRAGRALAALRPLAGVGDDLPVEFAVSGRPVITLVCPRLPLSRQVCSGGAGSTHRVAHSLPLRDAVVVAQLDLERSP